VGRARKGEGQVGKGAEHWSGPGGIQLEPKKEEWFPPCLGDLCILLSILFDGVN